MSFDNQEPQEELPDWLKNLRVNNEEEEDTPSGSAPDDEIFDEHPPLERVESEAAIEQAAGPQTGQEEDIPDWLASIRQSEGQSNVSEPAGDEEGDAEKAPAWLQQIREKQTQEEGAVPDEIVDPQDFLDRVRKIKAEDEVDDRTKPLILDQETADWLAELAQEGKVSDQPEEASPDWLGGLSGQEDEEIEARPAETPDEGQAIQTNTSPEEAIEQEFEELPTWLRNLRVETEDWVDENPAIEQGARPAFTLDAEDEFGVQPSEAPDWLSDELAGEEGVGDAGERAEEIEPDLAPAELPSWLQAMRPIETFAPEPALDDDAVEEQVTIGPLAGLRGVLPAEPDIVQFGGQARAYPLKLQVTESQQAHASLLEQMISVENEPVAVGSKPVKRSNRLLRGLIAALLFMVTLAPVLTRSQTVALPTMGTPPEVQATYDLIENLPLEFPVLMAFDFQPGFAGEMDTAAAAVVEHLLNKDAYLVLMSTTPTGPAQAERFLSEVLQADRLTADQDYLNLGYLSGGITALLSFADTPGEAFAGLEGVQELSAFAMLVIITDDGDTARAWIEQVQPRIGETPLVMVTSAQAEPLVRPYFESSPKQVNGLVSGVIGGAYYERSTGRHNLARTSWDAFNAGLSISVALFIIGGGYGLVSALIAHTRGKAEEAK